jgi:PIN domain nuclease of toxin-antitoxin system
VIVDTSALVAIVLREPGHETILDTLTGPSASAAIRHPHGR